MSPASATTRVSHICQCLSVPHPAWTDKVYFLPVSSFPSSAGFVPHHPGQEFQTMFKFYLSLWRPKHKSGLFCQHKDAIFKTTGMEDSAYMAKFIYKPKSMWPMRYVYLENRTLEPGRWGFLFQGWNLLVSFRQTISLLQVPSLICTRMSIWQVDFLIKTPKVIPKIPMLANASKYPTYKSFWYQMCFNSFEYKLLFWTTKHIKVEN